VVSGGSASGQGGGEYNGLFESNMTLDTAKAGLWSGGLVVLTEQTSYGNPLQHQPGNLSPVNATALWPKPNEDSSELMEYGLIQALPLNTVVLIGRFDPSNYLDQNSFSYTSDSQFLNVSMNSNPLWGAFLTYSTYATLFMTKLGDDLTLAYGAWTPDTKPGEYDGDWRDVGGVVNPQFKYTAFNHPGLILGMFAYSTKDSTDVGNPRLLPSIASGADLPTKSDNWLVELSGEQYFWEPAGASVSTSEGGRREDFQPASKDFTQERPGIGMFYRFSYTPEDRNPFNMYLSGGLGGRGIIPGRPYDRLGVGPYWLKESSDLNKQPGNVVGDEVGAEAFYNIAITPSVQLSLDVQWISPGIVSSDDAVVLGTRLNTRF
jgi:porin